MEWKTIDSCPTDGTKFIVHCEKRLCQDKTPELLITYIKDDMFDGLMFFHDPTHWIPLPNPPASNT